MEAQSLSSEIRMQKGKGAARQLRLKGRLPAILYGKGAEPEILSISSRELGKTLSTDYGRNVVIKLHMGDREETAMVKDLQIDPVTRHFLHVDFLRVDLQTPVTVRVPIIAKGRAKGIDSGGELNVVFRDVPVMAIPDKIPISIEIDVSNMNLNDIFQVQELSLPTGVSILLPPDRTLVAIVAESKKEEIEAEAALEGEEAAAEAESGAGGGSESTEGSKSED